MQLKSVTIVPSSQTWALKNTTGSLSGGDASDTRLQPVNKTDCEEEMESLRGKNTEKEILKLLGEVEEENSG